jgi:hypothetical protein
MLKTNPIRKGHVDQVFALAAAGLSMSDEKVWYAVCSTCGDRVMHRYSYPYYARGTRKNTKDALYRHGQEEHRPGSVGR